MPGGYRYIEHTADVEFVAYGDTLEELFENALLAMFNTIADIRRLAEYRSEVHKFEIEAKGDGTEDLIWETLQSALSHAEAKGVFAYKVEKPFYKGMYNGKYLFLATCCAKAKDQKFSNLEVKGVSRFDLKFKEATSGKRHNGHSFEANVVLDV